ncbi:MAG: hypothetical protein KGZ83_16970 [Sulfuricella sp.]|nr:hypothetical protein [Sulfuricella sp.]
MRGKGLGDREAAALLRRGIDILARLGKENRLHAHQRGWEQMLRDELAKLD